MSKAHLTTRYGGVLRELSAAEAANLDERGVPKQLGRQFRAMSAEGYDPDKHTVDLAISSETPVERWYGKEILSHKKGAIRTGRLKQGMPLLFNHNPDQHLGVTTGFKQDEKEGVLRTSNQFGTNPLATEKEGDVRDKILKDVSLAYVVHHYDVQEHKDGSRTYTADDWEPLENSLVTIPADSSVGVGRAASLDQTQVKYTFRSAEEEAPDPAEEATRAAEAAEAAAAKAKAEADDAAAASSEASRNKNPEAQRKTIMETTEVVDVAAQNAERVKGLRALHTQYPEQFNERSLKAAEDLGVSVEAARARVADAVISAAQRTEVKTAGDEVLGGMTDKDLSRYSISAAYRAAVNLVKPETYRGKSLEGGFEREVSEDIRKKAEERGVRGLGGGITIPSFTSQSLQRSLQMRALTSGGGAGTASNVIEVAADPIELLRYRVSVMALGARMMTGLFGTIKLPRQSGAASSNWLAESAAATESDITFDSIELSPSRLSMWNAYTRDLLAQSALAVDSLMAADRLAVLSRSLETAVLAGSGDAPVPLGLLNQDGLSAVLSGTTRASDGTVTAGAGGVPMTYVDYNNMEAAISTANADIGTMGWILTPKVRAAGRSTPQIPGGTNPAAGFVFPNSKVGPDGKQEGPLGYDAIATSNPLLTGFTANDVSGCHAVLLGVWSQILIGDWGLSEIIVDPYTQAAEATYNITEHAYYGTNVRHIPSFCACTSVLPS